jgi:tetratricopeptide (TPR) repeat protein
MKPYVDAIDRLREALRWFVAAPELRLLHVVTSTPLRAAALQEISDAQTSEHNRAPFIVLESPFQEPEPGWSLHVDELDEELEALREAALAADPPVAMGKLPARGEPRGDSLRAFATRVQDALGVQPDGGGLVIVLAPAQLLQPDAWAHAVASLALAAPLARVRWVAVEASARDVSFAVLGNQVERVEARPSAEPGQALLPTWLAGMKSAPDGAEGHRLAGMAGPSVAPPPRRGKRGPEPSEVAAQQKQLGLGMQLDAKRMQQLRILVLSAAEAFQRSQHGETVRQQREACDLAAALGLHKEAVVLELSLGAYLLQAEAHQQALDVFEQAITRARQAASPELEVQGHMAKAGAWMLLQRPFEAADAYTAGGKLGENLESPALAIECFRMVGQLLLAQKREQEAASAWQRALELGQRAKPEQRAASSASVAARDLAEMYRRWGMSAQADALLAQADGWDVELLRPAQPAAATNGAVPS